MIKVYLESSRAISAGHHASLDTYLEVTLAYFHNQELSNFLEKTTDLMTNMVRVFELMAEFFLFS